MRRREAARSWMSMSMRWTSGSSGATAFAFLDFELSGIDVAAHEGVFGVLDGGAADLFRLKRLLDREVFLFSLLELLFLLFFQLREGVFAALKRDGVVGVDEEDLGVDAGLFLGVVGCQCVLHQALDFFATGSCECLAGGLGGGSDFVRARDVGRDAGGHFDLGQALGGNRGEEGSG